jgi:hypothetical protein
MTYERGLGRGGVLVRAGAFCLVLLGCGDDDSTCLPASLTNTCVAQLSNESQMCFDPQGSCTWDDADGGIAFEWKNGARYELHGGLVDIRFFSSDGDECGHAMRISRDDCDGFRNEVGMHWVDSCIVRANDAHKTAEAAEYRCDDGRTYRVSYNALMTSVNMCMNAAPDLLHCVDENGVEFGKR